jgi:pyruvate/2-oxoglutarate dehydrogenase complex dihydrolipoamide dehydrogenase (E3) component
MMQGENFFLFLTWGIMTSLSPDQMVSIIRSGLGKAETPKKVMIVGAGMAGLVAGMVCY